MTKVEFQDYLVSILELEDSILDNIYTYGELKNGRKRRKHFRNDTGLVVKLRNGELFSLPINKVKGGWL